MKKRLLSVISAAAVILGSISAVGAVDAAALSPRSVLGIEDGYIKGIKGIPTVEYIESQFDSGITVVSPKGETLSSDSLVPAESIVKSGDTELGRVLVYGDANCDGKINVGDASAMLKKIAMWGTAVSDAAADVTADGKMNIGDVSLLLKYLAKWDVTLERNCYIDLRDGYKLLANDSELDSELVSKVKEATGVELEIITEAGAGDRYMTFGRNLHEKYDFIDGDAAEASDGLYIDTYGGNVYITVNDEEDLSFALQFLQNSFDQGEAVDIYRGYYGPVSEMNEAGIAYRSAVENILKTKPSVDGTNGMSEDIYVAISNARYTEPKNFIYMIGDGMGKNVVTAAEYCHKDDLWGGQMTMNYLPNIGFQSTYSSNAQTTDSAAGGTALATGYKTDNGVISMSPDFTQVHKTLLEVAAEKGKSTGIVATKSVTDATPASFTAHVEDRGMQVEIAGQQLSKLNDGTLDLVLGGGAAYYDDSANAGAMAAAKERGLTYTKDWGMASSSALPLVGLFSDGELATDGNPNEPHIADMTDYALEVLSENENGFFLMVEGSKIDTYGHNNDFGTQVDETYEFDCAVAVALRFVALNPDTVLIITADHETGGLTIPAEPTEDNIRGSSRYATGGHHWMEVPVYAVGYRTEELACAQENTDVAAFVAELMGVEEFGAESKIYDLFDLDDPEMEKALLEENENSDTITFDGEGIRVSFSSSFKYLFMPVDQFIPTDEDIANVSAIRITYTNMSDEPKLLPMVSLKADSGTGASGERITYVAPGATRTYTYALDAGFKADGVFTGTYEMALTMRSGSSDMIISDIDVVVRPYGK